MARERDRSGARRREKTVGRSAKRERERARSRRGERERSVCCKGGTRGEEGGGKKRERARGWRTREAPSTDEGQRWELKGVDERRCGGSTLFFVEDWTARRSLPLRRPSCPSTSSFLPSSSRRSFFATSSLSRASVHVCVQRRRECALSLSLSLLISYIGLPYISYFLTYTLVYLPRARLSRAQRRVRSLRRMTRRRATRRDHAQCSIGLSWGPDASLSRSFCNGL